MMLEHTNAVGNYWTNSGNYQEEFDNLYTNLTPISGSPASTMEGEMLRAASHVYHDIHLGRLDNLVNPLTFLTMESDSLFVGSIAHTMLNAIDGISSDGDYDINKLTGCADRLIDGVFLEVNARNDSDALIPNNGNVDSLRYGLCDNE